MNRRGFFVSVLALVSLAKLKPQAPAPVVAQATATSPEGMAVFSGDWNIYGASYHCTTYAVRLPVSAMTFAPGWELKA